MNYLYKGCCSVLQTSWIRNLVPFTPRVCYEEYTSLDQNGVEEDFIQSVGNLDRSTSWCSDACSFRKMNSCSFLCSWTVINDLQVTVGRIEYRTTVGPISQICQWVPTHPGPRDAFWKTKTIKYMFFSDDKFEKPVVFYFHIFFLGRDWFKHTHKEYHNLNPYLFDKVIVILCLIPRPQRLLWWKDVKTSSAHGLELGLMWLSNTGVLVVQKGLLKDFFFEFPEFLWIHHFFIISLHLWCSFIISLNFPNSSFRIQQYIQGCFFLFLVSNISRYFFPQTWNLSTWIS